MGMDAMLRLPCSIVYHHILPFIPAFDLTPHDLRQCWRSITCLAYLSRFERNIPKRRFLLETRGLDDYIEFESDNLYIRSDVLHTWYVIIYS